MPIEYGPPSGIATRSLKPAGTEEAKNKGLCENSQRPIGKRVRIEVESRRSYTLNELPQPQVLLTFGLLNLKPAPSNVSI